MNNTKDNDNPFRVTLKNQPRLFEHLLDWARRLPLINSEIHILDPFAGYGIEAAGLTTQGFKITAMERLQGMIDHSIYPVLKGDVFVVDIPDSCYSGTLVKDAWVFLTKEERSNFLKKMRRGITDNGSVLIVSSINSVHRAQINDGECDFTITTTDTSGDLEKWRDEVARERSRGSRIVAIEYPCLPCETEVLARRQGFNFKCIEYGPRDPLAEENRWEKYHPGYIAKLTVRK